MKNLTLTLLVFIAACSLRTSPEDVEAGAQVDRLSAAEISASLDMQEGAQEVQQGIERSADWTVDDFLAHYERATEPIEHDPTSAANLDLITTSLIGPTDEELGRLAEDGFVITSQEFPSFAYGYSTIYSEDLPVFISADSILFALHRSFDEILADIERSQLVGAMVSMLNEMRRALVSGRALGFSATQETDLDVYLTVALSLATGTRVNTVVGGDAALADELVALANDASGSEERALFGTLRQIDWSQFKPRGHYAGDPELERYFRATIWLGRIDQRILEPKDGNLVLNRRQLYNTLAMTALLDTAAEQHERINDIVTAFVGEAEGLTVAQIPELLTALGVDEPSEVKQLSDAEIATTLQKHSLGAQRISSHYVIAGLHGTTPLSQSFTLLPQRYVIDSHVLSNVVYDRVGAGNTLRLMPDPLDVAFAALGNDDAAALLEADLREYEYQHDLDAMRSLADAHPAEFWDATIYASWLGALRTLSTPPAVPGVPQSDAWRRRLLTAQLASWAELRHDTILYTKQSYTSGNACEYPDAYVEPNPAFFAGIVELATIGKAATTTVYPAGAAYFASLRAAAERLERMATAQETGAPHSAEDLAWVNQAVQVNVGCGSASLGEEGWYADLFYDHSAIEFDPTIADIHTQPTDADGTEVGRVLHVGTGDARMMVMTVDTCEGPRAYVGLASSYYEAFTKDFYRLTDDKWADELRQGGHTMPEWVP